MYKYVTGEAIVGDGGQMVGQSSYRDGKASKEKARRISRKIIF